MDHQPLPPDVRPAAPPPSPKSRTMKWVLAVLVLAVAIFSFWFILKNQKAPAKVPPVANKPKTSDRTLSIAGVKKYPSDSLPDTFPAGFPNPAAPADVQLDFSGMTSTNPPVRQSFFSFFTTKPFAEASKPYLDYLNQNGWQVSAASASLFAQKDQQQINIYYVPSTARPGSYTFTISLTALVARQ